MDKIYSAQDIAKKVEELAFVNAELEKLLNYGSNDERLVERKIELQNIIKNFKNGNAN
jgi:hypothetical protein